MEDMEFVPPRAKNDAYCIRMDVKVTSTRLKSSLSMRVNCREKMRRRGMLEARV
jgi:hypothetical protein